MKLRDELRSISWIFGGDRDSGLWRWPTATATLTGLAFAMRESRILAPLRFFGKRPEVERKIRLGGGGGFVQVFRHSLLHLWGADYDNGFGEERQDVPHVDGHGLLSKAAGDGQAVGHRHEGLRPLQTGGHRATAPTGSYPLCIYPSPPYIRGEGIVRGVLPAGGAVASRWGQRSMAAQSRRKSRRKHGSVTT